MKFKILYAASLAFLLSIFMVFTCSVAEETKGNSRIPNLPVDTESGNIAGKISVSEFPSSLIAIEEGAFEGTALISVDLPENVETIGDYAFANINSLGSIRIPNSTTYIGKNTFKSSAHVTIIGAPKSYARTWAHENDIPFIPITSFYAFNDSNRVNGSLNGGTEQLVLDGGKTGEEEQKTTGRMIGELNAEKKETIIAFHIQGRSPPMA